MAEATWLPSSSNVPLFDVLYIVFLDLRFKMHLKGECIAGLLLLSLSELVVHVVRDILLSM